MSSTIPPGEAGDLAAQILGEYGFTAEDILQGVAEGGSISVGYVTRQPHPNDAISTWETACRCGMRACRRGWPADAPLPADLHDPLPYLDEQHREARRSR